MKFVDYHVLSLKRWDKRYVFEKKNDVHWDIQVKQGFKFVNGDNESYKSHLTFH